MAKKLPISNPDLPTIRPDWSGNPLDENGRYRNLNQASERSYRELLRWRMENNAQKTEKKTDDWSVPIQRDYTFLKHNEDGVVWLGHCTFLIRLGGRLLLTDPVFGDCGPAKRRCDLPFNAEKIRGLDYVLISHNHRDHADKASLQTVLYNNPNATVLTGLQATALVQGWSPRTRIQEAGWWQQYRTVPGLEIIYLPAMHWSRRGMFDENEMLWGSYLLRANGKTIFFGADSGYDVHFQEIGQQFPGIDLCLLSIGGYAPQWFMQPGHTNPVEAVQAFHDLGGKTLVPMHYGTFDLSDEPFGEPHRWISSLENDIKGSLKCLEIGEFMSM